MIMMGMCYAVIVGSRVLCSTIVVLVEVMKVYVWQ